MSAFCPPTPERGPERNQRLVSESHAITHREKLLWANYPEMMVFGRESCATVVLLQLGFVNASILVYENESLGRGEEQGSAMGT